MEQKKTCPIVKDGVQGLIFVGVSKNILTQKIILVQDRNDRGRGDGIRLLGLPGGGIEEGEKPVESLKRELFEEVALNGEIRSLKKFGRYKKRRPNGYVNDNILFWVKVDHWGEKVTNDPKEVSKIHILIIDEIIKMAQIGLVHEGSIRLILNFINGIRSGSLNEPVIFGSFVF